MITNEVQYRATKAHLEQFEQAYLRACETLSAAKAEVFEKYDEILAILQDSFYELAEDSADRFMRFVRLGGFAKSGELLRLSGRG